MSNENATDSTIVVRNDVGTHRFLIEVDGQVVGYTAYEQFAKMRDFSHTEIAEEFAGRGLAGILVREALSQTKRDGMAVEASCPVVQHFLKTHPDF
nr:GNAT family N-acetyltransferase [Corynebacterium lactis]